ncbi:hypothetical protein JX266_005105 [Neoarthrinium moseri]|nr:hypothetical protein JX266_005105 [Neoarthrinium moseri]
MKAEMEEHIVPDTLPTLADLRKLKYIKMVIKETLRNHHPPYSLLSLQNREDLSAEDASQWLPERWETWKPGNQAVCALQSRAADLPWPAVRQSPIGILFRKAVPRIREHLTPEEDSTTGGIDETGA